MDWFDIDWHESYEQYKQMNKTEILSIIDLLEKLLDDEVDEQ